MICIFIYNLNSYCSWKDISLIVNFHLARCDITGYAVVILRVWSLWREVGGWRLWNKMQFRWNSRDVPANQSPGRARAPEVGGSLYSFSSQSARKEGYLRQRIINDRALSWCPRPRFPRFYRNREIRVSSALPGGSRWQVARERRRRLTPLARQRTVSCPRLTLNSSSEPSSGEGWAMAGRQNEKFVRRRSGRTGTTGDRWKSVPYIPCILAYAVFPNLSGGEKTRKGVRSLLSSLMGIHRVVTQFVSTIRTNFKKCSIFHGNRIKLSIPHEIFVICNREELKKKIYDCWK